MDVQEEILRISGVNPRKCMKCGKCSASCPAFDEMEYHPHQFVSMVAKGDIEPLLRAESFDFCLSCLACVQRCPRGVKPAQLIEAVRAVYLRAQGKECFSPLDVADLLDGEIPQQALVSAFRKYTR